MTAVERNYTWVKDHAFAIGAKKAGLAAHCFTVGEIQTALGFSRNTVKKYIDQMIENGIAREIVFSPSITIYRFNRQYTESVLQGVKS